MNTDEDSILGIYPAGNLKWHVLIEDLLVMI